MPEHLRLVGLGMRVASDQRNAMKCRREHLQRALEDSPGSEIEIA